MPGKLPDPERLFKPLFHLSIARDHFFIANSQESSFHLTAKHFRNEASTLLITLKSIQESLIESETCDRY
jgi:hypothetical protein